MTDIEEPGRMADIVASHLPLKLKDKQEVLETIDVKARLNKVIDLIHNEKKSLRLKRRSGSASSVQWKEHKRSITCASR